jgi:hypothetical protein
MITPDQYAQLIKNGETPVADHTPVLLWRDTQGPTRWLVCFLWPHNPNWGYSICDPGRGTVVYNDFNVIELEKPKGRIFRDTTFLAHAPTSVYLGAALVEGRMIEDADECRDILAKKLCK